MGNQTDIFFLLHEKNTSTSPCNAHVTSERSVNRTTDAAAGHSSLRCGPVQRGCDRREVSSSYRCITRTALGPEQPSGNPADM